MIIEYNFYGLNEYSVQYDGDDFMFDTYEEAEDFINTIEKENEDGQI